MFGVSRISLNELLPLPRHFIGRVRVAWPGMVWIVATVLLSLGSMPATARQSTSVDMDEILVTGQSIESQLTGKLGQYGNQLEVITAEQILKSGQNDVMQILEKLVPGLYISPRHGNRMGESDPSLQGGDDSTMLWLVDGVRVSMRLFGTFRTFIPPQYIDRIEVLKDGQGLFYGTQAIDGVVNIITRDGADLDHGVAGFSAGTIGDGEQAGHALVTHRTEEMDFLIFGSRNKGEAQIFRDRDFDATALNRLRAWDVKSVGLKASKYFSDNHFISLSLLRNDMEVDRPVAENYLKRTNDRIQDIFSLKYENQFNDRMAFYVKGYWHSWDTEWTSVNVNDDGSLQVAHDETPWWFEDYGFNAMVTFEQSNGSEWVGGIDMQKVKGADFVTEIAPKTETVWAGFVQYRPVLSITPETKFALGARYNMADQGDDSTIWSASARHPIGDQTYVRISGGTSFRNPNITELFQNQPGSTFCPLPEVSSPCNQLGSAVAGEDLKPQKSLGANVGVGGVVSIVDRQLNWELGYFNRRIEDLIQPEDLDGGGHTIVVRNADGQSTRKGFEAEGTLKLDPQWRLHMSGTWVDAENDNSDRQPDLVPKSFYKARLAYDNDSGRFGGQLLAAYTGEIYDSISPAVGGRQNFGEYAIVDLSGYYHFDAAGTSRLSLRVENLLDAEEAYSLDDATAPVTQQVRRVEHIVPPRNVQLTYTQKF